MCDGAGMNTGRGAFGGTVETSESSSSRPPARFCKRCGAVLHDGEHRKGYQRRNRQKTYCSKRCSTSLPTRQAVGRPLDWRHKPNTAEEIRNRHRAWKARRGGTP